MRILDFSSGNTCQNDLAIIRKMIDSLAEVDPERKFIIKWQLFKEAGKNIPLHIGAFNYAYEYAKKLRYKTTASVFDIQSLEDLFLYLNPCFVKIANRPDLYWLIGEVPRKIPVIVSTSRGNDLPLSIFDPEYIIHDHILQCISEYPTDIKKYENEFYEEELKTGISDHTTNWDLYLKYRPRIYECHFKLEDSTGLDAGEFARTPKQISEIYEEL